jgi:excisionase family DNA binding protein
MPDQPTEPPSDSSSGRTPRFLTLTDVAEILNTSSAQVYALVRRKELKALKIGGRGQWRVETSELEAFIARMYDATDAFIDEHPFEDADDKDADDRV